MYYNLDPRAYYSGCPYPMMPPEWYPSYYPPAYPQMPYDPYMLNYLSPSGHPSAPKEESQPEVVEIPPPAPSLKKEELQRQEPRLVQRQPPPDPSLGRRVQPERTASTTITIMDNQPLSSRLRRPVIPSAGDSNIASKNLNSSRESKVTPAGAGSSQLSSRRRRVDSSHYSPVGRPKRNQVGELKPLKELFRKALSRPKHDHKQHSEKQENQASNASEESSGYYNAPEMRKVQTHHNKKVMWRSTRSRREAYHLFKLGVMGNVPPGTLEELVRQSEAEVEELMKGKIVEYIGHFDPLVLQNALLVARKTLTNHLSKLLRFAMKFQKQEEGAGERFEKLQKVLKQPYQKMSTILEIYRDPKMRFFVDFLKERIFNERRMPGLILAMNIKAPEKLAMLGAIRGFIYVLNHPNEEHASWNIEVRYLAGDTANISRALREKNLSYQEVMNQLNELYSKLSRHPQMKNYQECNISYHFRIRLGRVLKRMLEDETQEMHRPVLDHLCRLSKNDSVENIKEILSVGCVRDYLKEHYISNKQFIAEVLQQPGVSCFMKKAILTAYPKFLQAFEDPSVLEEWQTEKS